MWMFRQGLRHRPLEKVLAECELGGHQVRRKDLQNYMNGWYRHELYFGDDCMVDRSANMIDRTGRSTAMRYGSYPEHPYLDMPEIEQRWVPCSRENKPMIKWSNGCMSLSSAKAFNGCRYLAENLRGTRLMVIDVDGDHGDELDLDALRFFDKWRGVTCCHEKPSIVFDWYAENADGWCGDLHTACLPTSYHLTFEVDRVIPTMHFPAAHVDIVGNMRNSLRYFKNKTYNGLPPMRMDESTWDEIMDHIDRRERR